MATSYLPGFYTRGLDKQVARTVREAVELVFEGFTYVGPAEIPIVAPTSRDVELVKTRIATPGDSLREVVREAGQEGLSATFGRVGANVARFVQRARSGEALKITALGDSILEGNTAGTPGTDDTMSLLATDLGARFGITVTKTNHADSGDIAAEAFIYGRLAAAIADRADLYVVSAYDKNDLGGDIYGPYAPGMPLAASVAALERIVRQIRTSVAKADIIIVATNPYTAGNSSNAYQQAKDKAVRRVAAAYGCEFVDAYTPFTDLGNYSALMADSTHPNSAGHRLIADTILDHLTDRDRTPLSPGAVAPTGLYRPEDVQASGQNYGYVLIEDPKTEDGITFTAGGTGWASESTSTVGDYAELSGPAIEFWFQMDTTTANAAVVDVAVDGATVATNVNLSTKGKQGTYWLMFASGLSKANHTVRVTLKSGTLVATAAAALLYATTPFTPEQKVIDLGSGTASTAIDTAGGYTTHVNSSITMPGGWSAMRVQFVGHVHHRVTGAITTRRYFHTNLNYSPDTVWDSFDTFVDDDEEQRAGRTVHALVDNVTSTAARSVLLRTRLLSTDKTLCQNVGYSLKAVLTRTA